MKYIEIKINPLETIKDKRIELKLCCKCSSYFKPETKYSNLCPKHRRLCLTCGSELYKAIDGYICIGCGEIFNEQLSEN